MIHSGNQRIQKLNVVTNPPDSPQVKSCRDPRSRSAFLAEGTSLETSGQEN